MLGIVLGVIVVLLGSALLFTESERKEGRNLPIDAVDFNNLNDGTYVGEYEGGRYKWRANEVQVTVSTGEVTDIKVLKEAAKPPAGLTYKLFSSVIESQSLRVDTVSGATITSRAYLKTAENALDKAKKR